MYEIFKRQQEIIKLQGEIIEMQAYRINDLENPDNEFERELERIINEGPIRPEQVRGEVIPPPPNPSPDAIVDDMDAIDSRRKKR